MPQFIARYVAHFASALKTGLLGPQILAFVPALTLAGYWFGGETMVLFLAIFLPAFLGLVGLFNRTPPPGGYPGRRDPITNLPGRTAVLGALDAAFAAEPETGRRTAALMLEIDEFGHYRTRHGDTAADLILLRVSERIVSSLRDNDILARLDKAIFAVALSPVRRLDLEDMIQLSARLQQAASEPVLVDGLRLYVTVSVGFCLPRRAGIKTGIACLDAADVALTEAQSCGPGSIRAYSAQPRRKRVLRAGLVGEVAAALENGQIKPWFQPQISTDTAAISGVEALARWEHPDRGIILPGAFLPAISAAGLDGRLSELVLNRALSALQAWDRAGLTIPNISVNFAGEDLSDPTLCDKIRWELDRFDLGPAHLTVEVLETVIAQSDNDTISRNIARLSDMGCRIDLDDFGTGHASIANIRRFSVDRIKIDRSFVTRIDTDREQQQMLTAILEMANRLGIETLAEGVETVGEHALLSQLGCGHVQGYSVARPMPFGEVQAWVRRYREKLAGEVRIPRKAG